MRTSLSIFCLIVLLESAFSQQNPDLKFILVPHPRSEDKVQQSVLPQIEKINYFLYDMVLLGGDLCYYTSINRTSMNYCDSLFNLDSPNTLWTMGNHDLNSPSLVAEYTKRPRFYSYYRDSITFLVLDTEENASGFSSSHILGNQLQMIKNVSDTISNSGYLVVLHGRLLWMIGNEYFVTKIDSVAESTRQLDTSNFYQEVYPLLQKVKSRRIKVICLGGDKSKINIEYFPEDSIGFYTSTMAPEFEDSVNHVIVFDYFKSENRMEREFIPLNKVEKNSINIGIEIAQSIKPNTLIIKQLKGSGEIVFSLSGSDNESAIVQIYSIDGRLNKSFTLSSLENKKFIPDCSGIYIVRAVFGNHVSSEKLYFSIEK